MSSHNVLIKAFRSGGQTITAKVPFEIEPIHEDGLYIYKRDDIGLDCFVEAKNLHRAPQFVVLEMAFIWRNYALEADDKLDAQALQVKKNLCDQFTAHEDKRQ